MIKTKKNFIFSIVVCAIFCLLSTGVMQPIQAVQAMETKSDRSAIKQQFKEILTNISINVTQEAENIGTISIGNTSRTIEFLENGKRVSTISNDGEVITYEITTEFRPISDNTDMEFSLELAHLFELVMIKNGTETVISLKGLTPPPVIEYPYELPQTRGAINYWWDNVYFFEETGILHFLDYPHPDKTYYDINSSRTWLIAGNNLLHVQVGSIDSAILFGFGDAFLAEFCVNLMENLQDEMQAQNPYHFNPNYDPFHFDHDANVALYEGMFSGLFSIFLGDEDGCIWIWASLDWLAFGSITYPYYMRLARHTIQDWLYIGNPTPPPPHKDIASIVQYPGYGTGYVANPWGARYSPPDNDLALIYGISANAGGQIVGKMSGVSKGNIYVYAASVHGYNTRLYVYVSNDNQQWYPAPIPSQVVQGGTGWHWVHFGNYNSNFQYIGICAINNQGQPVNIYIDSAIVTPY